MYAFTVFVCLGFPFCIPTCLIHTLVEGQQHLLCVTEPKWDPQLCNIWQVLRYWFQMKKSTTLSCLSCHGNVWNVSCAPGKTNTDKSHHATSNCQLLCFFGVPARNAFIIFTSCCAYLVKKKKKKKIHVCVRVFNSQRGEQNNGKGNGGKVALCRSCQRSSCWKHVGSFVTRWSDRTQLLFFSHTEANRSLGGV